jgi:hypothetical protein
LRSIGVQATTPIAAPPEPPPSHTEAPVEIGEAWATDIDPTGARAVWLLGERRLGGVWFAALLLNDLRGLQDMNLVDTTRKRFQREFAEHRRDEGTWVTLPGEYALRLVREAVDLTREQGGSLPARYRALRDVFGEAPGGPERALVYETISPVEASFNPNWLDESPRLFGEREVAGWYVPAPADLRPRALEVARGPAAGLLVPGHTPEDQALQLLADASDQALTPAVRRALRRRLEETAYIFLSTDRLTLARLAVGAARGLEDSKMPAERHPLLRILLTTGLARLIGGELVGSRRATESLAEIVERAISQRENQKGGVETRPSGLILPR